MEQNGSMEDGREWKYGGCKYGCRKRMEVWMMVDRSMELWKLEEGGSMDDGSMASGKELKYEWWLIEENWREWKYEWWLIEENGSMEGERERKYGGWKYTWWKSEV